MINIYQRIRLLAERGHEVGLATFLAPEEERLVASIRPYVQDLEFVRVPRHPHTVRDLILGRILGLPGEFAHVRHAGMQRLVGRMVDRTHYDVVVAEFSAMGQYLYWNPFLPAVRRVISCHSCLTTALRKAVRLRPYSPVSWYHGLRLQRLRQYEFALYRSADLILTLTAEERLDLLKYDPDLRIGVVPYGVDVEHFQPHPVLSSEESICFVGYFAQEQNRDAFHWFVRTTWPRLKARHPGLKFYVVGSGATRAMYDVARRDPKIVVTGPVEDVVVHLNRAKIFVCPIRMGTGFRGKILQAMAAGVPVVSTALAAEGIPAQTGHNILLADTPHTIEESVNLLLSDSGLRRTITANARDLVVRRFAWSQCVNLLEQVLREVTRKEFGARG